jgi:hypothetical protein
MIIEIYGKDGCGLCHSAQKKIDKFLKDWEVAGKVNVVFHNMDTPEGAAEGDWHDVFNVPTVLLKQAETEHVVGRWEGPGAPHSDELRERLCA